MGASLRPAPPARRIAGGAMCCRQGAISRRSIPAPSRRAPRHTLGAAAAQAVVTRHLQDRGDYPRRIVMDLWASPTLRSGGEDIAHALALMGVAPLWDHASTRITGFSIIPQPKLAFPRLDVTIRISGAFRDTFPAQIALLDAAARAVAALDEPDDWNEPAAARRRGESGARIFGAAPGALWRRHGRSGARRRLDRSSGAWLRAISQPPTTPMAGLTGWPAPMPGSVRGLRRLTPSSMSAIRPGGIFWRRAALPMR